MTSRDCERGDEKLESWSDFKKRCFGTMPNRELIAEWDSRMKKFIAHAVAKAAVIRAGGKVPADG
jgi:hypothetical protein